jgi:hypothetical protein
MNDQPSRRCWTDEIQTSKERCAQQPDADLCPPDPPPGFGSGIGMERREGGGVVTGRKPNEMTSWE